MGVELAAKSTVPVGSIVDRGDHTEVDGGKVCIDLSDKTASLATNQQDGNRDPIAASQSCEYRSDSAGLSRESGITVITSKSALSKLEGIMPEGNLFSSEEISGLYGYDCSTVPALKEGRVDLVKFMQRPSLWDPERQMKDDMYVFPRPGGFSINQFVDKANEVAEKENLGLAVNDYNRQEREFSDDCKTYRKVHAMGEWVVMPVLPAPRTIDSEIGLTRQEQDTQLFLFSIRNPGFYAQNLLNTTFLISTLFLEVGRRFPDNRDWLVTTDTAFSGLASVGGFEPGGLKFSCHNHRGKDCSTGYAVFFDYSR